MENELEKRLLETYGERPLETYGDPMRDPIIRGLRQSDELFYSIGCCLFCGMVYLTFKTLFGYFSKSFLAVEDTESTGGEKNGERT